MRDVLNVDLNFGRKVNKITNVCGYLQCGIQFIKIGVF
jgi:hypothetical protein